MRQSSWYYLKGLLFLLAFWGVCGGWGSRSAQAETLRLIHVGNQTDSMAASLGYLVNTPYVLLQEFEKQSTQAVTDLRITEQSVCFYRQGTYLWGPGLDITAFKQQLTAQHLPTKQFQRTVAILDADDSVSVAFQGRELTPLHDLAQKHRDYRERTHLKNATLHGFTNGWLMLQLPEASAINFDPLQWEMIIGLTAQMEFKGESKPWRIRLIGKHNGEDLRRLTLIRQLRQSNTLLVQSGNLLPGINEIAAGQVSFQRPLVLKMAQSLNYFAIAVGMNELRGGLDPLQQEQQRFALPLLSANLRRNNQTIFAPYRLIRQGRYLVAFIGLTSAEDIETLKTRGVLPPDLTVLPVSEALGGALEDVALEAGQKPDLVVVLTNARNQDFRDIRAFSKDIHLIAAEESAPNKLATDTHTVADWATRVPLVLRSNRNAINHIWVGLTPAKLTVRNDIHPVGPELEPDPYFLPLVMQQRQDAYEQALYTLLPDMKDVILKDPELLTLFGRSETIARWLRFLYGTATMPPERIARLISPRITREMMLNLMANLMLASTQSEVAILNKNHTMPIMPGNLPKVLVYEMLKTDVIVESWAVTGKQLKDLARLPDVIMAGTNPEHTQVWGSEIRDKEIYQALILSDVAAKNEVKTILKGANRRTYALAGQDAEAPVYLQNLVLRYLESLRHQPDFSYQLGQMLKPQGEQKKAVLSIEVKQLQFNLKQYDAVNNAPFDKVRVTRVNSPDSLGFSGNGEVALRYDSQGFAWKNGVMAKLDMMAVADKPIQENQDDLVLSSELKLHFLGVPMVNTSFVPYLEALYDTEFSPTVGKDGIPNPRQAELGGVLGFSLTPSGMFKKVKTGFLLRRDFNRVQGNLETGFILDASHELPLSDSLKWQNDLEFKYVLPNIGDSASDLALTLRFLSTVKFTLTQNLALNLFADTVLFQGKVPTTSQMGASFLFGAGLSYERIWKPAYEPLF